MEQVKCPECGGIKCIALNNETYRCLYCGATIKVKPEAEVQQTADKVVQPTTQQVIVQVQVPPQPVHTQVQQQPEQQLEEIKKDEGIGPYLFFLFYIIILVIVGLFFWDIGLISLKSIIIAFIANIILFIYYILKK